MTFPSLQYNSGQEPPFSICIEHRDKSRDGHWRPAAFIMLTPTLRTSGFLLALPPEDLKSFLLLLTFLTPNGECRASLAQLASAFHLSIAKTRARLQRLAAVQWQGQPVIQSFRFGNGLEGFAPVAGLLPVVEEKATVMQLSTPVYRAAPRELVIEHSRRTYGRPRAEVERQISERMGWQLPEDKPMPVGARSSDTAATDVEKPNQVLREKLLRVGLLPQQADELLSRYDAVRIERQLMWLPYRAVRNQVGFLIVAVKDDYAAPLNFSRAAPNLTENDDLVKDGTSTAPVPAETSASETAISGGLTGETSSDET